MRNPVNAPDSSPGKQSELKLNVGIGILGTILSLACAVLFFLLLDEIILGAVFVVIALVSAAITIYVRGRLVRARRSG
jgi:hypothetical protein